MGERMGPISGFIFSSAKEPSLYIASDTIYRPEVEKTLATYEPSVVVVNAGAAQFSSGLPITMTAQDVLSVLRQSKDSHVVTVHMETINHCLETKGHLNEMTKNSGYRERLKIASDGELLEF